MPIDAFTYPDLTNIVGSMTVVNDPRGNNGNVNIQGTLTASGSASFGGITGTFASGVSLSGGLQYDEISGSIPATTSTQALASGGTITLTGSGRILRISCSDTSESTLKVTPTASSLTGTSNFANGVEVTVVNVSASGTNAVIPSASLGAGGFSANCTISAGCAVRLMYVADIGWVHLN